MRTIQWAAVFFLFPGVSLQADPTTRTVRDAQGKEWVFTQVGAEELKQRDVDSQAFGVAWRDPSGMIWGDLVQDPDGWPEVMDQAPAAAHCQRIGATLPTREDFIRLREYLGAPAGKVAPTGYAAQVLPNLTRKEMRGGIERQFSNHFWSASTPENDDRLGWFFEGGSGYLYYDLKKRPDYDVSVRCVVK